MRQRVALARALAYGGDLYLLDEPFHALDERTKSDVIALLQKNTPDALKLFVTHDKREAEALANITYIFEGTPLKIVDTITKC
jgi:ABC-type nitrate/sulfonate/bicarbonate transport system, ATPase component